MKTTIHKEWSAAKAPFLLLLGTMFVFTAFHHTRIGQATGCGLIVSFIFMLGAPYLGAVVLGHEFDHQTLLLCLLEPKRRMILWLEKMFCAAALLTLFTGVTLGLMRWMGVASSGAELVLPIAWAVNALFTGPLLVLLFRTTLGAAGVSFLGSLVQICLIAYLEYRDWIPKGWDTTFLVAFSGLYSLFALVLGVTAWRAYELRPIVRTEGSESLLSKVAYRWSFLWSRRGVPTANVWRREWMFQRGNAMFAFGLCVLLLSCVGMVDFYVHYNRMDWIFTTSALAVPMTWILVATCAFVGPVMIGVRSGEENRTNASFLSMTQPRRLSRQMLVRLIVGLGLSWVFGSMPAGMIIPFVSPYSDVFMWLPYGRMSSVLLMSCLGAGAFGLGWLSSLRCRSSITAMVLSVALSFMVILGWLLVHEWVGPGLVRLAHPGQSPVLSWWSVRDFFQVVNESAALSAISFGTIGLFIFALLRFAHHCSQRLHTPLKSFVWFFSSSTFGFLVAQLALSLWVCSAHR